MKRLGALALTLLKQFPPLADCRRDALAVAQVMQWLQKCRAAWVEHPQFEYLRSLPELKWLPFDDETWAEVALVFRHKPGQDNRCHSFIVTDVRELPYAYAWATRTRIGDFIGVYPLPEDLACDPTQMLFYSFTHEGRAKGYHARMELKRLLPPKLRPLVSKHRRASRQPKLIYLTRPLPCNGMMPFVVGTTSTVEGEHQIPNLAHGAIKDWLKTGVELPEWFTSRTKADLWVEQLYADEPELHAQLAYWMGDPRNFYLAVTSQVEPNEVEKLFVRLPRSAMKGQAVQMQLF